MSSTTTTVTSTDGSVAFMDGHRQLQQGQQSRLSYRLSQVPYFRQSMISEAPPTISATLSAPFEHAFDTPTFLTTPELTLVSPASTHEVEPQSGTMEQSNNSNNAMTSPTDPAFLGVIREEPRVDADGVSVLDYEGLSTSSSHQSSSNSPGGRSRTGSARMHSGYHSHHASSSATRMLPHTTGHSPQSVSSVSSRGTNSSEERRRAARSATQRIGNLFKRSKSATRGSPQEYGGFLERRSLTPLDIEIAPPPPPKDYPRAPSPHRQQQQEAEPSYHHYLQPSPFNPPRQQNPEFLAVGRVSSSLGPGWGEAEFINLGQRRPSTTSSFSEKKGDKKKKKDAGKPQNPQVFGVPLKDSIKLAPSKIRISHSGKSTSYRVFPLSVYKCCEFIRSSACSDPCLFSVSPSKTIPGQTTFDASAVSSLKHIFSTAPSYGEDFSFFAPPPFPASGPAQNGPSYTPVHNRFSTMYTPYDAARLVLIYLSELPKPVVSKSVLKSWILLARQEGAIQPPCGPRLDEGLDFWAEALNRLSIANRNLVKHLLGVCAEVLLLAAERARDEEERLATLGAGGNGVWAGMAGNANEQLGSRTFISAGGPLPAEMLEQFQQFNIHSEPSLRPPGTSSTTDRELRGAGVVNGRKGKEDDKEKRRVQINEQDAIRMAAALAKAMFHIEPETPGKKENKNAAHPTLALAFIIRKRGEYLASLGRVGSFPVSRAATPGLVMANGNRGDSTFLPSTEEILGWRGH